MKQADLARDNPAFKTVDEVLLLQETDRLDGLTAGNAARRLAEHGPNALVASPGPSVWRRALSQFQDPLIYLLLFAISVSVAVWALEGFDGWPIDAVVIALIVLLNGLLGHVQQAKAAHALAALARMTEVTSSVIRGGASLRIPSAELVAGDLLVLGEGDAVGADARLIKATALRVQEGSLTGESEAVAKDIATVRTPAALGDRSDMVFKGTSIAQGTGQAIVTATGMRTEMGAVAALLKATVEPPSPLEVEVARIGRMLAIVIAIITLVVVTTVLSLSDLRGPSDVVAVLLLGVSLAVAAVPEGLPAILSVVLALGVQRMARRNAIVKNLSSVETLGAASVICSDKTGTLTRAEMTLQRTITASGSCNFSGIGYAPTGRVESGGEALGAGPLFDEVTLLLGGGCLAGDAELGQDAEGQWRIHGDPTEAAFLVAERKMGAETHARRVRRFERVGEIPFTSERKMMSTIERDHDHGGSQRLFTKGAPDVLLDRCTHIQVGDKVVALDAALRAKALADVADLSDAALRTLSVAWRQLASGDAATRPEALEQGLVLVGTVGIIDPPRQEAALAIAKAQGAGIRVVMITGDHPRTAWRIATDLGIGQAGSEALTGLQIDAMNDAALARAVLDHAVFARVAPAHKLRIVAALQSGGAVVAMTGDGVNDAPALKAADIGIAMGITGTEVSRQAARMILADDNFATIVVAVEEGRAIFDSIRKFLRYLLSSNMGEVLTVFLGVVGAGLIGLRDAAPGVVLPLLATQILWVNLVTDSGPALAMGVDPADEDVMARGPRGRHERIIDAAMWWGVIEIGTVMAVATLLTIDLYLPGGLIAGTHDLTTARTAGFTVLVLAQLFNCFNARSDETSAFSRFFGNPWLWAAVSLSALLQVAVVELDFLNAAFGTAPLAASQWLTCIAMASSVLWFSELRKAVRRFFHRRKAAARARLSSGLAAAILAVSGVSGVSGCASMAPAYQAPAPAVAATYAPQEPVPGALEDVPAWHDYFTDPQMQSLIAQALRGNRDLRMAVLRVQEARALHGIQRSDLFPVVGVQASLDRARLPGDLNLTGQTLVTSQYQAGLGVSTWEIDFWGRVRSLQDAALQQFLATAETRRAATLALIAQVADSYLLLVELDERIDLARSTLASRQESLRIFSRRVAVGSTSRLDLTQVETLAAQAYALHSQLQQARAAQLAALTLLLGSSPVPFATPLRLESQTGGGSLRAGVPSDLLERRPDIMAAEHRLRASDANIGAARAAFFPRIALTGSLGTASAALDGLFAGGSGAWSFSPSISLPLFDGARRRSDMQLSEVRRDLAVADYEKTVQGAFRDVSVALSARRWLTDQASIALRSQSIQTERARLSRLRYDNGAASFLEVLDAERAVMSWGRFFIVWAPVFRPLAAGEAKAAAACAPPNLSP